MILGQDDPLGKEMATHSSALAWKIPWTEEAGRGKSHEQRRLVEAGRLFVSLQTKLNKQTKTDKKTSSVLRI